MNLSTLGRYLIGNSAAIERVATDSRAIWTGIVLVLLTAIARNYDQTHFSESRLWLLGPLLFSFVSGTFLYAVVYGGFIQRHIDGNEDEKRYFTWRSWRCYMSLFWMTAPIAWLYAIPVERFRDSYSAAKANLYLLGIVSVWRILLMSRAISVVHHSAYSRTLCWVGVAACIEVLVVFFFGQSFARRIMVSMGGLRNSPEETMVLNALSTIFLLALASLVMLTGWLAITKSGQSLSPVRESRKLPFPFIGLFILTVIWVTVAIGPQNEQRVFAAHAALVQSGRYRESIEFLINHSAADFPASRRLEPNPYEWGVFERLPVVIGQLRPEDPEWIRERYLSYLDITLDHLWHHARFNLSELNQMFLAIERLPDGADWIAQRSDQMGEVLRFAIVNSEDESDSNKAAAEEFRLTLKRLGVTVVEP